MPNQHLEAVIKLYIDTSKTFIQLSCAGLIVPIALKEKVLSVVEIEGQSSGISLLLVCLSWMCLLIAIGSGVLYQYAAVKFLEYTSEPNGTFVPKSLERLVRRSGPGLAYGVMVVAFFLGAVLIVAYSFLVISV